MEFKLNFKDIFTINGTIDTPDLAMITIAVVASSLGIAFLKVVA